MRHCLLAVALFCASHAYAAHPVISELLFNVPNDPAADPNLDGTRDAAADEFIELHNPTDKPIALQGYALRNRLTWADPTVKRGVAFTFPDFTLPANATVVLFNGYNTTFSGPVGTPDTAPTATNLDFDNAYVFTMSNTNRTNAFRNSADFVVLIAPDGEPVSCVGSSRVDLQACKLEYSIVSPK